MKDVLVVVGKHGHNYLNDNDPPTTDDTLGVGKAFERLEKVLEQVAERQRECGSPRHRSALLLIDKLTDATARRKDFLLDEASHPNAVYPSTSNIKTYAKSLRELVESLKSPGLRDEWPTTCRWHKELTLCDTCRSYLQ